MVLTAGTLSLISAGSNSAKLSTTQATGGTAPYTVQWYRDTSGAGFTPGSGNLILNATGLILNNSGLVPNTTYFYKVVYTDSTTSTVESTAFIVTTLPASQGMNQFAMAAILGELDLQSGPKNVVAAQVDASQSIPLYPGQPIKFVNNPYGIPTIISTGTDMPNGYIVYDQKSQNFPAGSCCEIAKTGVCIWLYSTAAITRGSMVTLDPDIAYGVKEVIGTSGLPIIGEAFDQASAAGQLLRIILNVPSNMYDTGATGGITSNILEIDDVLSETEDSDLLQHLLKSTVNSLSSNQVAVQIPISSPVSDNLVSMDGNGNVKDSGVSKTTDSSSNDNSHLMTSAATQAAILAAVAAAFEFQGGYDASGGTFPTLDQSGSPISKGDFWVISVAGTLPGSQPVSVGDQILALIDIPGQTPANWVVNHTSIGVTSFNGRTGPVTPQAFDYSYNQVTGAAPFTSPTFLGTPAAPTPSTADNTTKIATTAYVQNNLVLKANLASPTFTGTVTVPPPSASTDAATKGYVDTGLSSKADTSAVSAALALKADLNSPALTGTPTAPTASPASTSTTQIATTAFTHAAILATFLAPTQQVFSTPGSGSYTLPTSPRQPLYLRVQMCGGGGGGQGSANSGDGVDGGNGGNTTFGPGLTARGGTGGTITSGGGPGGTCTTTIGYGQKYTGQTGGTNNLLTLDSGFAAHPYQMQTYLVGGNGGSSLFAGGGNGAGGPLDLAAIPNTGGGGAGAWVAIDSLTNLYCEAGTGGGGGGYLDFIIPAANYSWTLGAGGTAGGAGIGVGAQPAGAGASGVIIVTEYYQ